MDAVIDSLLAVTDDFIGIGDAVKDLAWSGLGTFEDRQAMILEMDVSMAQRRGIQAIRAIVPPSTDECRKMIIRLKEMASEAKSPGAIAIMKEITRAFEADPSILSEMKREENTAKVIERMEVDVASIRPSTAPRTDLRQIGRLGDLTRKLAEADALEKAYQEAEAKRKVAEAIV
jgi:hypothetical protein